MSEASSRDPALAGYWPSHWPCEDGGPRRTQAPASDIALDLQPGERLSVHSRNVMVACMTVLRDPGELYLQGHLGTGNLTSTARFMSRLAAGAIASTRTASPSPRASCPAIRRTTH
jgi:hypothetical protein